MDDLNKLEFFYNGSKVYTESAFIFQNSPRMAANVKLENITIRKTPKKKCGMNIFININ